MAEKVVVKGSCVSVDYTGKLLDGKVFDTSIGREPLDFTVGAGQMIKGFDEGVLGMKLGEKKTITLAPEQAYGASNPMRIITVDKKSFPQFDQLKVGLMVGSQAGLTGRIVSKGENEAVIDFNHELAGKTLVFEITLVSIN